MKSLPKGVPPVTHKSLKVEDLGNITGRRTNGITTVGGGEQLTHTLNHYGKDPPQMPGMDMMLGLPGLRGGRLR